MNCALVQNILDVIKTSTDKKVVVKGLTKLRTDLVKNKEGIIIFRNAGGIAPLVHFLTKPHEQILEITLSILGNCCTDAQCCTEAFENNISLALSTILKSIPKPIIQCRASRLLGNLAKVDAIQAVFSQCSTITRAVTQIILNTSDVQTRIMAIRACRFLLENPVFFKHFLEEDGLSSLLRILTSVLKNVTPASDDMIVGVEDRHMNSPLAKFIKNNAHREIYFQEVARNFECVRSDIYDLMAHNNSLHSTNTYVMPTETEALELLNEILKFLLTISELKLSNAVWQTLNRSGVTLAPLVFCARDKMVHRGVALKILSNFAKNVGAFGMLSVAGATQTTCELLIANNLEKPLTEIERSHCIQVVCFLSLDACNRSKIRLSGTITKLLTIMRTSQSKTLISAILYLLNNFEYDNLSLDLMLKEGVIKILIRELDDYLTNDDDYHKRIREEKQQTSGKKRKFPEDDSKGKNAKARHDSSTFLEYDSPCSSPKSNISPPSPCSSRSLSPVENKFFKISDPDSEDDEHYSPVCSDDDDDEENDNENRITEDTNTNDTGYSHIIKLLDEAYRSEVIEDTILDKDDDVIIHEDEPAIKAPASNRGNIDMIENLIFRISLLVNKDKELGKPETITTIIKAINVFGGNNNFANSLTNILVESQFFAKIIENGIVHRLYQLTKVDEMSKDGFAFLETLTCVAESNYGRAKLAHLLRTDENSLSQKRAAISVAYLIKNTYLLHQFLYDGNALSILLNLILGSDTDELAVEAIDALTCMSRNTLQIFVPTTKTNYNDKNKIDDDNESCLPPLHDNCDMRFIVHKNESCSIMDCESIERKTEDGVVIGFNKQLLCESSEVFDTMMNNLNFREGKNNEIHLNTVSVGGLRYFLKLLVERSKDSTANVPFVHNFKSILEAFEISRVYILPTLEKTLQHTLVTLLDESNCLTLLEWAITNYHCDLIEMSINYYLCSYLPTETKIKLFRNAKYSKYSNDWYKLLSDAVLAHCSTGVN